MRTALALVALTCLPAGAAIRRAAVTQDLAHPPRLEQCMRELLAPLEVKSFAGPVFGVNAEGQKDRRLAAYRVRDTAGHAYAWSLRASDGERWRFFSYDTPTGTALGMFTPSADEATELRDAKTKEVVATPDLSSCAKFIGQ